MKNLYHSLLLVIAGSTQKELAAQIRYLKIENQILRSKLGHRVPISDKERRRLIKFAGKLTSKMLQQLVSIVHPETLLRWVRDDRRAKAEGIAKEPAKRGRPKTPEQLRRLIRKLARENDWGYTRIMGEIKKLGLTPPSRNTVKNILKSAGLDPGPQRGEGTWDEFLTRHAASLWQCDFFSRKVLTARGIRQAFVLAFLNVKTRRVILSPATYQPNAEWIEAQAESFVEQSREEDLPVARLMRDRDGAFTQVFDAALRRKRVKVLKTQFRSPNLNAYVERFVQSIKQECLDHFVIFGAQHMDVLCREFLDYYHHERPHQSKDNLPLVQQKLEDFPQVEHRGDPPLSQIACRQRLGGLLKHYYYLRRAA